MPKKNMWGDNLADLERIKTPASYLREQAESVGVATNFTLRGEVSQAAVGGGFRIDLDIVVPAINDYTYTLLTVRHPVEMYPLTIADHTTGRYVECANEEQFLSELESILSSPGVRSVMSRLISLSAT